MPATSHPRAFPPGHAETLSPLSTGSLCPVPQPLAAPSCCLYTSTPLGTLCQENHMVLVFPCLACPQGSPRLQQMTEHPSFVGLNGSPSYGSATLLVRTCTVDIWVVSAILGILLLPTGAQGPFKPLLSTLRLPAEQWKAPAVATLFNVCEKLPSCLCSGCCVVPSTRCTFIYKLHF